MNVCERCAQPPPPATRQKPSEFDPLIQLKCVPPPRTITNTRTTTVAHNRIHLPRTLTHRASHRSSTYATHKRRGVADGDGRSGAVILAETPYSEKTSVASWPLSLQYNFFVKECVPLPYIHTYTDTNHAYTDIDTRTVH